jgi:NADH dehydrogenase
MKNTAINYIPNIPGTDKKRIVVIGAGFAGLKLVRKLIGKGFQIILLDRNNFHQFQPLLYQVATAGLEPSAISFPIRKVLQKEKDVYFRIAELKSIDADNNEITTNIGSLSYDYLVLATGVGTNFFGQESVEKHALSMKTASDSIKIRNTILENFEQALIQEDEEEVNGYLNIVLVGGGPTGVELAGALAEMKKYIFPKDYPELDLSKMRIVLYEASPRLLAGMSEFSSEKSKNYLEKLGVEVHLDTRVTDYDGSTLKLSDGGTLASKTVIWAAGVRADSIRGLIPEVFGKSNRIRVDRTNRVLSYNNIFAIGDMALMETPKYPDGHTQVAQVAIQQAKVLSSNILKIEKDKPLVSFEYTNRGSLATIGRHLAVADLPIGNLKGYTAWFLWSVVHLFAIFGVKNRIFTFLNWLWNYFTYDQSLRVLIKPKENRVETAAERRKQEKEYVS